MTKDWRRVEEIFHGALALTPAERTSFVVAECGGDESLRKEVESLLAAESSDSDLPAPFVPPADPAPRDRFDSYKIIARCGQGATGTVYRALDPESGKDVAIKIFAPFPSVEQRRRYLNEARATAALHHPNIARVRRVGRTGDRDYLVMDYVDGRTLGDVIPAGGLPWERAMQFAHMTLEGLAAAHDSGIVHRDLKPSNLMVDANGVVRILDFGLAKIIEHSDSLETAAGQILGTACYLSPEQAEGLPVDARSDVFSFGVVLYEMLTGEKPFDRGSLAGTLSAILRDTPPSVRKLRPGTPRDVARLVERCLEKDRDQRYGSVRELLTALETCEARLFSWRNRLANSLRRPKILAAAIVLLSAALAGTAFGGVRWMRLRKIRKVIEPQIAQLVNERRYNAADVLVGEIEGTVPNDELVREFRRNNAFQVTVVTTPPGAEIAIQDYGTPDAPWRVLGKGPIENIPITIGYFRWRVSAAGYRTRYFAETAVLQPLIHFTLYQETNTPAGMELVPDGGVTLNRQPVKVPAFWLDRYEVTNRQYLQFVRAGGYHKRDFWQWPFVREGRTLSWEQAMEAFRDQTGQLSPAGWEQESYPPGKDDFPVTGVSWYEAAAYARFAGKSLPTYAHWLRAAHSEPLYADSVLASNFSFKGLAAVGSYHAMDRYGTYDLAGNAKEWLWNDTAKGLRLAMGGGWNEPYYMSALPDAAPPMDRRPDIGFRCAKYDDAAPPAAADPVTFIAIRDYSQEKPVDDAAFEEFRQLYDYAPSPLRPAVESIDDSDPFWRKERVSFDAAYGNQRVIAYLFIPRGFQSPYQTVVYYPSGLANSETSSGRLEMWSGITPIIQSGRAVMYPVLWGTYERHEKVSLKGGERRRMFVTRQVQDLRRSVEYLDTRADIDHRRLALYGFSAGGALVPIAAALIPRFQAILLAVAGLPMAHYPPETDPFQFAPRARAPVLMVNGRYDIGFEVESSQKPLLNLFGAKPADKKLVLVESGHALVGYPATTRESLAWLDRYLGPVAPAR